MKKVYITKPMTWNDAIQLAHTLKMRFARADIAHKVLSLLETVEPMPSIMKSGYMTSTTYRFDTSRALSPVDNIVENQQEHSETNNDKESLRRAILVPKDFELQDAEMGRFIIG